MAKTRQEIEHQFRRGTNTFFWIGALSALGTSALYHGFTYQPVGALCLATPMVLDVVVRAIDPRLFGQQIHYYCYMFSLILAAVFVLLGLLSRFSSHTGAFLKLSSWFRSFAKIGNWLGMANLAGSRLFYFTGMVLYTLDGGLAFLLENLIGHQFTELKLAVMLNLAVHFIFMSRLLYGFALGFSREAQEDSGRSDSQK